MSAEMLVAMAGAIASRRGPPAREPGAPSAFGDRFAARDGDEEKHERRRRMLERCER